MNDFADRLSCLFGKVIGKSIFKSSFSSKMEKLSQSSIPKEINNSNSSYDNILDFLKDKSSEIGMKR